VAGRTRSPRRVLHHIPGVLTYAYSFFEPYESTYSDLEPWCVEVERFHDIPGKLDESLREKSPAGVTEERLLQGPLSASMAHAGQLLLLRRMAGSPCPPRTSSTPTSKRGSWVRISPNRSPRTRDSSRDDLEVFITV